MGVVCGGVWEASWLKGMYLGVVVVVCVVCVVYVALVGGAVDAEWMGGKVEDSRWREDRWKGRGQWVESR